MAPEVRPDLPVIRRNRTLSPFDPTKIAVADRRVAVEGQRATSPACGTSWSAAAERGRSPHAPCGFAAHAAHRGDQTVELALMQAVTARWHAPTCSSGRARAPAAGDRGRGRRDAVATSTVRFRTAADELRTIDQAFTSVSSSTAPGWPRRFRRWPCSTKRCAILRRHHRRRLSLAPILAARIIRR